MISVTLNGAPCEVPAQCSVLDLLDYLGLGGQPLLVELNGVALLKSEWQTVIQESDRIELVRVVAGG